MYNPFGDQIVGSVVDNLRRWATQGNRKAYVIYVNPVCRRRFDLATEFQVLVNEGGLCVWRLQDASIHGGSPAGTGQ